MNSFHPFIDSPTQYTVWGLQTRYTCRFGKKKGGSSFKSTLDQYRRKLFWTTYFVENYLELLVWQHLIETWGQGVLELDKTSPKNPTVQTCPVSGRCQRNKWWYPPVTKRGDGESTIYRWFSHYNLHENDWKWGIVNWCQLPSAMFDDIRG